ncbi:tobH protein [Rhodococcus sp. NPDC058505]|uniref:tobH protein n=1 Tax=unclassified Rhodococcus (in: high G+C Gram-positive bacteria) TaxID=192944 RepID=UPI00364BA1B6
MTAPSPLLDLDDAASVAAADTEGAMRAAALGGAQVRSVAEAVAEGMVDRLRELRPRSVVIVTSGGRAARAASVLGAAIGPRYGLPVLSTSAVPPWVGPLDVVVVAGDDAGDPGLVDAADSALRRGAELVVVARDEGPLGAAATRGSLLAPRVPVPDRQGFLRYLAAGLAVLGTLDAGRGARIPDLVGLADRLDAEAARNHPSAEVFHNPAKSLAVRMQGHRVLVAGDGPATAAFAGHTADMLLRTAGVTAAAADLADALASAVVLSGAHAAPPGYDPLFHDEELDGPLPVTPARVFVLATAQSRNVTMRRIVALPDAELLSTADGVDELGTGGREMTGRTPGGPDQGDRTEAEQLAVLAVRFEMAAVYLRLIGGR